MVVKTEREREPSLSLLLQTPNFVYIAINSRNLYTHRHVHSMLLEVYTTCWTKMNFVEHIDEQNQLNRLLGNSGCQLEKLRNNPLCRISHGTTNFGEKDAVYVPMSKIVEYWNNPMWWPRYATLQDCKIWHLILLLWMKYSFFLYITCIDTDIGFNVRYLTFWTVKKATLIILQMVDSPWHRCLHVYQLQVIKKLNWWRLQ